MAFNDIREFIDALDRTGDVVRIKQEVDWELEAGAISRRAYEMNGPATLFEKIKDYPEGFPILGGCLGTYRRVAIALGLAPNTPTNAIHEEYARREEQPIKPSVVASGPCKENVMMGDKVDLYRFPAPLIHDGDGGRYLATWCTVVSKDPDTGWTNWGMYRFMIHNKRSLVGTPAIGSHFWMVFQEKYISTNQPMPMAIAIGTDPLCSIVSTNAYRIGEDEADFAGALRQEPVELVKCETNDLLVPAHSEIIIEGEALPDMTAPEGPFGEYPGYRTQGANNGVLCRVKAITYRNSPIVTMICLGMPVDDNAVVAGMTTALSIKRRLKRRGIPVTEVYAPPEAACHLVIVSVKSGGCEVAEQIMDMMTARRTRVTRLIVVDDDVDVFNLGQVLHAFATKCHPAKGTIVAELEGRVHSLAPAFSREERKRLYSATALNDCTWPPEWSTETDIPVKASFDMMYPRELKDKVTANWSRYGFK